MRSRQIIVEASACGVVPPGGDKEYEPCNEQSCTPDVDCVFRSWTRWSDCSCTCDGVKTRSREISVFGSGTGKWCNDATREVQPCHTSAVTDGCMKREKPPENCVLSKWSSWGQCFGTCDRGQRERTRKVLTEPKHGGR